MLPEQNQTDLSLTRRHRAQARVAGVLASLWAQRLAIALQVPQPMRGSLGRAARHITSRNFRGILRLSALPIVERYRQPSENDLAIGLLRVAEAFTLGSMQPWCAPRATIAFMRNDEGYYPPLVLDALERCLGIAPGRSDVALARRGSVSHRHLTVVG